MVLRIKHSCHFNSYFFFFFFFLETIELSKVIMFYGGIVFQWLWWWVCLWFMWLLIGSCLLLTLCLTVKSSAFELLIVSTLVQWWLASNHYLYHGWLSYGTSYLIITCVIHKIMHLWIMVIFFSWGHWVNIGFSLGNYSWSTFHTVK